MTHEQAEKRLRQIIEIVVPLLKEVGDMLHTVGLKKPSQTIQEISYLMTDCLNTIDQIRKEA